MDAFVKVRLIDWQEREVHVFGGVIRSEIVAKVLR